MDCFVFLMHLSSLIVSQGQTESSIPVTLFSRGGVFMYICLFICFSFGTVREHSKISHSVAS